MTLQEKLNAIREQFESTVPGKALEVMHRAVEDLRQSGAMEKTLKPGARAPGFDLKNTAGTVVRSKDLLARGPVVLGFFRGRW